MDMALELTNVTKNYDGFTLNKLSLSLPRGCIMGLIGENGAGKSTTIKLILDLVRRDEGDIRVLGCDCRADGKAIRERLGVVMDESCFPENLSAADVGRIMGGIYLKWDEKTFQGLAKRLDLPAGKTIREYSRGMKMKLSIAAALSHGAQLLVLDEATSGLDPVVRDEILDLFLDFMQDENHAIFMSSHILSDLEKVCDYIAFLHKGKLIFSQSKDELLDSYGILKCTPEQLAALAPDAVHGVRRNSFGVEALVLRDRVGSGLIVDRAGIEDIMLFYLREERL